MLDQTRSLPVSFSAQIIVSSHRIKFRFNFKQRQYSLRLPHEGMARLSWPGRRKRRRYTHEM